VWIPSTAGRACPFFYCDFHHSVSYVFLLSSVLVYGILRSSTNISKAQARFRLINPEIGCAEVARECVNMISRQFPAIGQHQCAHAWRSSQPVQLHYLQGIPSFTLTVCVVASAYLEASPPTQIVRVSGPKNQSDLCSNLSKREHCPGRSRYPSVKDPQSYERKTPWTNKLGKPISYDNEHSIRTGTG